MLWIEQVQENGLALYKAPPDEKTAPVCRAAVARDGRALTFVPEPLREQVKKAAGIKQGE
jgi:hypothetical protein